MPGQEPYYADFLTSYYAEMSSVFSIQDCWFMLSITANKTYVCIMCMKLSFVRSFYIYWMHPVISVDCTKFIHQIEHEQLMDFFPFTFFYDIFFRTIFNADEVLKKVKVAKNQLQLITRLNFRS